MARDIPIKVRVEEDIDVMLDDLASATSIKKATIMNHIVVDYLLRLPRGELLQILDRHRRAQQAL